MQKPLSHPAPRNDTTLQRKVTILPRKAIVPPGIQTIVASLAILLPHNHGISQRVDIAGILISRRIFSYPQLAPHHCLRLRDAVGGTIQRREAVAVTGEFGVVHAEGGFSYGERPAQKRLGGGVPGFGII